MIQKLLDNNTWFIRIGIAGTAGMALGTIFKLLHLQGTLQIMQLGMILFAVFGVWTLGKVYFSNINFTQKLLWMLGILVVPVLGIWVYHIVNKRI